MNNSPRTTRTGGHPTTHRLFGIGRRSAGGPIRRRPDHPPGGPMNLDAHVGP